ncbi:TM2 domain-containing protein [Salpingoeca rosetta]|uniref:TM2 domain-containing protein n=1 Tax=Salpingoeca rosetta (strain ATCC 50818 / BSB-021) TaxID=946362 RepID=F2UFZ9_SALR5|nr:TM2 domain-containing protein [Salpingoeca rosetta]EGD75427.1 TM2 domain-containing protein [Salpingoeca rosetta]|eukprot:XP_004991884.1 TM2 domain-containing protein [Salpingoeca rosetta]
MWCAREFSKNRKCNWSSGKVWSSAFLYSATLGGFGADRFYLGDIGYGVFKLLSFGGLAVWSMVDAILVAVGFLHPEGHWVLA